MASARRTSVEERLRRPPTTNGARKSKLAERVAGRIVDDVIDAGWPVGEVLGSEADLLQRYGTSRAVFREAVRLVEHQHVARMRRGPGGGLVIAEPTARGVVDAAVLYLHRVDARLDEVLETRLVLEELVAQLVPSRLNETDLVAVRGVIEKEAARTIRDPRELHSLLARISRNPALELFVDILNRVMPRYLSDASLVPEGAFRAWADAHAGVAEAVLAGDPGLARHRMRKHLEAEAAFIRRRRASRQLLDPSLIAADADSKRAEGVARQIFQEIVANDLEPGHFLGSESDLIDRYGVSRAVLREAVRLLEHHHIATMRRGPGGGFTVAEPSVDAVTDAAAVYLEHRSIAARDLLEVRAGVEQALVDLLIRRLDDDIVEELRAAAAAEETMTTEEAGETSHDLHAVIARLAGNRALELVALVCIRLTRIHQQAQQSKRVDLNVAEEVRQAHGRIVEAIVSRDVELARHRMRRHIDKLADFLR